jgi:hypothetical protein
MGPAKVKEMGCQNRLLPAAAAAASSGRKKKAKSSVESLEAKTAELSRYV